MVVLAFMLLPVIALADAQILDHAQVFSDADIRQMDAVIQRIEKTHQVDMVLLTTYDVPDDYSEEMWRVQSYADDFYDNGGYGMGEDDSGMLILLDLNNRVMWLSTGGVMYEYINDAREESILDAAYSDLRHDDYGSACTAALLRVENFMEKGRAEGTFIYDEATGKRLGGIYNVLTQSEMLLAALIAIAAAAVLMMCVGGSYNLTGSTYSYNRNANASIRFTKEDETFVRQFVNRTPRSTGSHGAGGGAGRSGGSGVHRSSGGVRHGGGGRRF